MPTYLYHATTHIGGIDEIDLSRSAPNRSQYGRGFYYAIDEENALDNTDLQYYVMGGRGNGPSGMLHKAVMPEKIVLYPPQHGATYINGDLNTDSHLVERIAKGLDRIAYSLEGEASRYYSKEKATEAAEWRKHAADLRQNFKDSEEYETSRNALSYLGGIQNKFGYPKDKNDKSMTSVDVFAYAGIDFMYSNGVVVSLSNRKLPELIPNRYYGPCLAGAIINRLRYGADDIASKLNPNIENQIYLLAADVAKSYHEGNTDTYDRFSSLRYVMDRHIPDMPPQMKEFLDEAEKQAAVVSGMSEQELALRQEGRALLKSCPERNDGEGFFNYTSRIYSWYDKNNSNNDSFARQAFLYELRDQLFRESQYYFAHYSGDALCINRNPRELEKLLHYERLSGHDVSESMAGVPQIEYENDSLQSNPGIIIPNRKTRIEPELKADGVSGVFHVKAAAEDAGSTVALSTAAQSNNLRLDL